MSPDKIVLIGCVIAAAFWGGLEVGMRQPIEIKECPKLDGNKVISTTINLDKSQTCQYMAHEAYGKARKQLAL